MNVEGGTAKASTTEVETKAGLRTAVRRLTLTDFRNYPALRLDVDGRSVVLTGANGAGKTNVLEAVSFLVPGRGLRRTKPSDAVRQGARTWAVAAQVETPDGPVDLGTGLNVTPEGREKRLVRINGETMRAQTALGDVWSVQWLTPQMDRLFIEGAPARRRFLDRLIYGADGAHAGRVSAYEHALRERSKVLRGVQDGVASDPAWLSALEDTIATKGIAVAAARLQAVDRLAEVCLASHGPFPGAALAVSGEVEDWLRVLPALETEDKFRRALEKSRDRDRETGGAATGPHRSDFKVRHAPKNQPAELCSTGEQKALLIAIVLGNARLTAAERGQAPVLLLDEVAAHLDEDRRRALFDSIEDMGAQAWMTGTDRSLFAGLENRAQFVGIADGALIEANADS